MSTSTEIYHKLNWKPTRNGITVAAALDIKIRPANTNQLVLFVPGVDGSADGYKNKYVNASDILTSLHQVGIIRISNDFISSFHWEDNVRQTLNFIGKNFGQYFSHENPEISIVAYSAGASIAASVAWEYPLVKRLLLINTPEKLQPDKTLEGLKKFKGVISIVYGEHDPSVTFMKSLKTTNNGIRAKIIKGADHSFSGNFLETFEKLPLRLFEANTNMSKS